MKNRPESLFPYNINIFSHNMPLNYSVNIFTFKFTAESKHKKALSLLPFCSLSQFISLFLIVLD